jgi:hypothetical protein
LHQSVFNWVNQVFVVAGTTVHAFCDSLNEVQELFSWLSGEYLQPLGMHEGTLRDRDRAGRTWYNMFN